MIPARDTAATSVVYVANSPRIGGGARVLMELMRRLDPARFRPFAVAPAPGPFAEWCAGAGVPVDFVPWSGWEGRTSLLRGGVALARVLLARRAGIVHAAAPTCYRAVGLAGAFVRAVRVCHLGFPPEPGELARSFGWGPEAVIGCYEGQARALGPEIAAIRPGARVVGIPNGVDVERFSPPRDGDMEGQAPWRFGARHVVLICGHLSEVKGHPTFLRAAARIAAEVPDCAFAALGGETVQAGFRATLERLAADLGIGPRVHFLGFRDDVPTVLRAADIVVLPSREEGLPLAVLEAMACARPVVATPVGGVPEAVADGETGLLVPPDDPGALADAVLRILGDADLAARLGAAARRRVVEGFSLAQFARRVAALYDELLARSGRRGG